MAMALKDVKRVEVQCPFCGKAWPINTDAIRVWLEECDFSVPGIAVCCELLSIRVEPFAALILSDEAFAAEENYDA
jgi:hypothetical protein